MYETVESFYDGLADTASDWIIFPSFGIKTVALIMWCLFTAVANYFGQQTNPMAYSKFAPKKSSNQVSGNVMYLVAYFPAFCAAMYIFYKYAKPMMEQTSTTTMMSAYWHFLTPNVLLILHFAKRLYESLFVHISTSKSNFFVGFQIGTFYALGVIMMLYYQLLDGKATNYIQCEKSFVIGIVLFIVGQYGNYYHHYLLRLGRLNNKKKNVKYVVPTGGFFRYVWCPHYLFEIVAWLGMAVVSKHLMFYVNMLGMTGYLIGRSKKTKEWYTKQFGAKCPNRKAIIPLLV